MAGATWFDVPRILGRPAGATGAYGGFPMGLQSYSLRGFEVDDALDHIADLGLQNVEFYSNHYPTDAEREAIEAMDRKLADRDIIPRAHGVNGFDNDHQANERIFWFARMAGLRTITADPAPASFDSLEELVARFNIRIAIHNHGPDHRYDVPDDVLDAVEGRDERIGFCADLGHYIRSGVDPVDATRQLGDRLYGIHLKDFASSGADAEETIIGEGMLDVDGFFQALKEVGFPADGALSLEYELNPDHPIDDLQAGLAVAAEAARKVGDT